MGGNHDWVEVYDHGEWSFTGAFSFIIPTIVPAASPYSYYVGCWSYTCPALLLCCDLHLAWNNRESRNPDEGFVLLLDAVDIISLGACT